MICSNRILSVYGLEPGWLGTSFGLRNCYVRIIITRSHFLGLPTDVLGVTYRRKLFTYLNVFLLLLVLIPLIAIFILLGALTYNITEKNTKFLKITDLAVKIINLIIY